MIRIKAWMRKKILELIGQDIDRIARDAYNDGYYFAMRESSELRKRELAHLNQHNEHLMKLIAENHNLTIPPTIMVQTDQSS